MRSSCVEPVFSRVLHGDEISRCARGRGTSTSSLNAVYLAQADAGVVAGFSDQRQPVDGACASRAFGGVGRGLDIPVLGAVQELADGRQVESGCAIGGEVVVAEEGKVVGWGGKSVVLSCSWRGIIDGAAGNRVQHIHAPLCKWGGVVESSNSADGDGGGAYARARIVLDSSTYSNVDERESCCGKSSTWEGLVSS